MKLYTHTTETYTWTITPMDVVFTPQRDLVDFSKTGDEAYTYTQPVTVLSWFCWLFYTEFNLYKFKKKNKSMESESFSKD